jgi:hypothetical protein
VRQRPPQGNAVIVDLGDLANTEEAYGQESTQHELEL